MKDRTRRKPRPAGRQDAAVRLLIVLLVMVTAASLAVALAERLKEQDTTRQAVEESRAWRDWVERLAEWLQEMRLRYGVTEPPPEAPEVPGSSSADECADKLAVGDRPELSPPAEAETSAAGITYAGGFDWQAVVTRVCTDPGWRFTDNPDEYLAWAKKESAEKGDPSGKAAHLWRTGQALRNGWHTYPMGDGYRQAARELYAACCIDDVLAEKGSPLAGHGLDFVLAGRTYGVDPYLLVGLTAAESSYGTDGSLCRTHHNAWGMKGPNRTGLEARSGWMWWPDWGSAVWGAAWFVSVYWPGARTAYDCRGYCEGNPPAWVGTVEYARRHLEYLGGEL